jgi:cytidine deaminase
MQKQQAGFEFEVYSTAAALTEEDLSLLEKARRSTDNAYAPYSGFRVCAVARLVSGEIVTGTNLENASYPAGICAEQALLGTVNALGQGKIIESVAISYRGDAVASDHPISPCGICRQALTEFEVRTLRPIRLILAGLEGEVYIIPSAQSLLPLAFTSRELKRGGQAS